MEETVEAEKTGKKENILGTEKIGKLIRKFSIPAIIALLVNSLYNIIDQVFIGWGVGYLGNGATNVVYPLTVVALAFSQLLGDGAASFMSLKLGEKKKDEASKGVGNAIFMAVIVAVIIFAVMSIFLPQLLNLFGCTDALREYALDYGRIIIIGLPFMMLATALNSLIRADGSPNYGMASMVTGVILNIILDPVFIFVFGMGVQGAAIATVIAHILTFVINALYARRFKNIILTKESFKLKGSTIGKVASLGISSFITTITMVILSAVQNNLLKVYGADSKFGSEIPITVLGIVMKINMMLTSVVIGIATGTQPIIGYNYGAKKYDRVKKTFRTGITISVIVTVIAWILFQTIPDKLITLFGSGDELYMEFACDTFRIYLMVCFCAGVQIPLVRFCQSIGKSMKSALISLSRQIIILIPAMFILTSIFGLYGVLYAGAVADSITLVIVIIITVYEMKHLTKAEAKSSALIDDTSTDNILNTQMIITISREYGSGGRYIGRLVADKLGIKFYDKDLIIKVSEQTGLSEDFIESNEEKRKKSEVLNENSEFGNSNELFIGESNAIKELAKEDSCVIVGRCADFILKDNPNVISVFIYSDMESKEKRATEFYGLDKKNAKKEINNINKQRENHYKYYTGRDWKDPSNYDICLNSDVLGVEKTADVICELVKTKENALLLETSN